MNLRPESEALTVQDVAAILRISKMSIYRAIERRELRAYRLGRSLRIRRDDLEDYLRGADTYAGEL